MAARLGFEPRTPYSPSQQLITTTPPLLLETCKSPMVAFLVLIVTTPETNSHTIPLYIMYIYTYKCTCMSLFKRRWHNKCDMFQIHVLYKIIFWIIWIRKKEVFSKGFRPSSAFIANEPHQKNVTDAIGKTAEMNAVPKYMKYLKDFLC